MQNKIPTSAPRSFPRSPASLRRFVRLSLACLMSATCARAEVTIIGQSPEGPIARAEVPYTSFAQTNDAQRMPQWCWAASISNVFGYYGHPVSQERIVATVYGGVVNMPALSARKIAELVNRDWVDDNGQRFHSRLTAAYDAQAGVFGINNAYIIENLVNDRPLIVCNTSHCMVMTEVVYTPMQILSVGVFDPWPLGPMTHDLQPAEIVAANLGGQLMFVGAIEVTDARESSDPDDMDDDEFDSDSARINGVWRGTPTGLEGLPIVFHIDLEGDSMAESPNQGAEADAYITLDEDDVEIDVPEWGVTFEGELRSGRIRGTLHQHGRAFRLSLRKSG